MIFFLAFTCYLCYFLLSTSTITMYYPPSCHLRSHSPTPTRVRSSGSQVCDGNRNHRAETLPVLRRAPTLSDEKRQQCLGLRALSLSPSSCRSARRRDPGKAKVSALHVPTTSRPRESPSQGLISFPHGQTIGNMQTLYLAPLRANQDVTLRHG